MLSIARKSSLSSKNKKKKNKKKTAKQQANDRLDRVLFITEEAFYEMITFFLLLHRVV